MTDIISVVAKTKAYYDGPANLIYDLIWGGKNLHLGIPCSEVCPHPDAMVHTNEYMANAIRLSPGMNVLDLGCGYGETARWIALHKGCHVTGTNISEKELRQARLATPSALPVSFEEVDFHNLPYLDETQDVVWSQESFLHAADRTQVLREAYRVLHPGGTFVFTDLLITGDVPPDTRERILSRVHCSSMWKVKDYTTTLHEIGFRVLRVDNLSRYVARSYDWVAQNLAAHRQYMLNYVDAKTIDDTLDGLVFWVNQAEAGNIGWGFFHAVKPN